MRRRELDCETALVFAKPQGISALRFGINAPGQISYNDQAHLEIRTLTQRAHVQYTHSLSVNVDIGRTTLFRDLLATRERHDMPSIASDMVSVREWQPQPGHGEK